jgi:hypothetical protein
MATALTTDDSVQDVLPFIIDDLISVQDVWPLYVQCKCHISLNECTVVDLHAQYNIHQCTCTHNTGTSACLNFDMHLCTCSISQIACRSTYRGHVCSCTSTNSAINSATQCRAILYQNQENDFYPEHQIKDHICSCENDATKCRMVDECKHFCSCANDPTTCRIGENDDNSGKKHICVCPTDPIKCKTNVSHHYCTCSITIALCRGTHYDCTCTIDADTCRSTRKHKHACICLINQDKCKPRNYHVCSVNAATCRGEAHYASALIFSNIQQYFGALQNFIRTLILSFRW